MASTKRRREKKPQRRRTERGAQMQTAQRGLPWQNTSLICLFLASFSLAVYGRSLFNGFINYDDRQYITENPHVQAGLTGETIRWAFTTYTAGNWHPVTWICHAFDVQMFGLVPAGHHLSSMIFHALNAMLLFLLLAKATGFQGRSLVVAALFAAHPLNVECVAWAAERKSLLSTLLFFLALGAYGWYASKPSVARYGALAILFALGLMAKPMVITLPFVLLLLDYWPLQRMDSWTPPRAPWTTSRRRPLILLLEKLPLLLLSAASAVTTMVAQLHAEAVAPLSVVPVAWRVENAVRAYVLYLFKAIWPVGLAPFYPETSGRISQVLLALLLLAAISICVWRARKRRPYLVTGWLWYLGSLVPVIGLVQVGLQGMADRYAYTPIIGIFVMLVWYLADIADSRVYGLRPRLGLAAVILIGLASFTWRQVHYWQNSITLWEHTLQVTRDNMVAEDNMGTALMDLGRDDEAITHFRNAIRVKPTEPKAHIILGALLQKRGDAQQAIEQCKIALQLTRDPADLLAIYTNLGAAYRQAGDYAAAGDSFRQVLQRDPSNGAAMVALGRVSLLQAAERLSHEVERHPTADGFSQLATLWEQGGDIDRAREASRSALALNSNLSSAQNGQERRGKGAQ